MEGGLTDLCEVDFEEDPNISGNHSYDDHESSFDDLTLPVSSAGQHFMSSKTLSPQFLVQFSDCFRTKIVVF